ncbi:hypothetical protein FQA39_LY15708 [Lamprigera yunnana]|nr:hypothetical protein FQA39_LY15708 [Lamprigera yunnana]
MFVFVTLLLAAGGALGIPSRYPTSNLYEGRNSRIINGVDAADGEFPFQVSLRAVANSHYCGGSIISEYNILSAAHCFTQVMPGLVFVGTNRIDDKEATYYQALGVRIHEDFNMATLHNDVAVVRVDKQIVYTNKVYLVALDRTFIKEGMNSVISGWGRTEQGVPNKLQRTDVRTISNEECGKSYLNLLDSQICTYSPYNTGICGGDSGGPVTHNGIQIGIVSFTVPCAVGHPDGHTRVSSHYDWIHRNMQ